MKHRFFTKVVFFVSLSQFALVAKMSPAQQLSLATSSIPKKNSCTEIPFSVTSSIKYNNDDIQRAMVESFSSSAREMWGKIENRAYFIGGLVLAYMIYQVWDSFQRRKLLHRRNELLAQNINKKQQGRGARRALSLPDIFNH